MKTDTISTSNLNVSNKTNTNEDGQKLNLKAKGSKINDRKIKQKESQVQTLNDQIEIEPEAYFTRTDTTVHFSRAIGGINSGDEYLNSDSFHEMDGDEEWDQNSNRVKCKNKSFIKNKFKRLKTSLNIEVIEDDDDNPSFNDFSHIV